MKIYWCFFYIFKYILFNYCCGFYHEYYFQQKRNEELFF
jgi:hypothetical protein